MILSIIAIWAILVWYYVSGVIITSIHNANISTINEYYDRANKAADSRDRRKYEEVMYAWDLWSDSALGSPFKSKKK